MRGAELIEQMNIIIAVTHGYLRSGKNHWETCNAIANDFDLWENDRFPIWLSRVVEGEMRDLGIED